MRHSRLTRLTEINNTLLKNADNKISIVKDSIALELRKLQQLLEYRDVYVNALRKKMNNSTEPEVLRRYLSFIGELEQTILQQQQLIVEKQNKFQQLLESRQLMYRQHKPVEIISEKLILKHRQKQRAIAESENEDVCIAHYHRGKMTE